MATPPAPAPGFRQTFECLAALSVILDLANGLAEDKSLLTGVFALELAQAAGFPGEEQWSALLAAMLRHLGCTAYASVEAQLSPDDIALRARLNHTDTSRPSEVVRAVASAAGGGGVLRLASRFSMMRREWTQEACGAAKVLSAGLQLGPAIGTALDEVFERWDGRGGPHGRGGEALSRSSRVARVAHTAVVHWLLEGQQAAAVALRQHGRDGDLDPALATLGAEVLRGLPSSGPDWLAARQDALLTRAEAVPLPTSIDDASVAFGDFADLQSPFTRGHSRAVAASCARLASALGLTELEKTELARAAHLHDLGQVAIPTSIWTLARTHRPSERERARAHVYFTERVLASAPPLAQVARIAGAHHERLDGSGYHRGHKAAGLPRAARILAVAEVFCALQEPRPHRPALSSEAARAVLTELARGGQLDASCVDAALSVGTRRAPAAPAAGALTARELEVLGLLATGKTNKEIATHLDISARTVQHHTIHVYEKLGVDTRAGAALIAAQRGLLGNG